jgi:hypothetical protein
MYHHSAQPLQNNVTVVTQGFIIYNPNIMEKFGSI